MIFKKKSFVFELSILEIWEILFENSALNFRKFILIYERFPWKKFIKKMKNIPHATAAALLNAGNTREITHVT